MIPRVSSRIIQQGEEELTLEADFPFEEVVVAAPPVGAPVEIPKSSKFPKRAGKLFKIA
jgi:hypothetical protein